MKKLIVTLTLLSALVTAMFGQGFSTDYVLKNFEGTRIDSGRLVGTRSHIKNVQISSEEMDIYGGLGNGSTVDTPTELLAMAACLGIQDVRKEDALKCYAEIATEGAANQYLGKNTTHSQVLARLQAKYNFTQREIRDAIGSTVAAAVDTNFKLTLNGFVPAAVYAEWKAKGIAGGVDAVALIKEAITNFCTSPTRENYAALTGIYARYWLNGALDSKTFTSSASDAFYITLRDISPELAEQVSADVNKSARALASVPADPRFNVFSTRYGVSGE